MAFCKNCGTQLKDGATFCKNCGTKLNPGNTQNQSVYGGNIYGQMPPRNYANPATEKMKETLNVGKDVAIEKAKIASEKAKTGGKAFGKKTKEISSNVIAKCKSDKRIAIGLGSAAVGVVALVAVIIILVNMNKKVAVDECITVEVAGYNTLAEASVYINDVSFMNEVAKAQGIKLTQEQDSEEWYDQVADMHGYELLDMVSVSVEKTTELSNGDKVEAKISFDNKKADKYGITFVGETYTYEVSGLEELKDYDPFSELQVKFEGIAPNVYLQYYCDSGMVDSDNFSADKTEGINIGDEVTITFYGDEEYLQSQGYKVSKTSQTYTCENVDKYIEVVNQLSGESFDTMKDDAQDCVEKYFADNYESIKCSNLNYAGSYVLSKKNFDGYENNLVYVIYSGTVSSKEKYDYTDKEQGIKKGNPIFKPKTVYMPICFENVILKADGIIQYELGNSEILGTTDLSHNDGWSRVKGYTDGERMYNDLILSNQIDYTYDVSENLTKFGSSSEIEESAKATKVTGTDDDFIFPDSNSKYLSNDDLKKLSKDQLRTALNELYARRGYIFEDEGWKEYFEKKDWYDGRVEGEDFDDSVFNKYETANKDLIVTYEKKKGYR